MSLKILHVIPSVSNLDGGTTIALSLMERALFKAGAQVTTLTTDHGLELSGISSERDAGLTANATRVYHKKRFGPYKVAPGMLPWLYANIRAYDVVHTHGLFSFAPTVAAWAARLRGVPYIMQPHGMLSRYGLSTRRPRLKQISASIIEETNLARAGAVLFTTQAELDEARNQAFTFRGVVIPIGLEAIPPTPLSCKDALEPHLAGRTIFLYLSRIDPKKNIETLIDTFAMSPALQSSCVLLIAGTGSPDYIETLQQRAKRSGGGQVIHWLGHVEGARKAAAFAMADVFVLPSYSENFGIAVVEALLAGLPCVLGKGVALSDVISKSGAGVTIEPNTNELVRALEKLHCDQQLRLGMASKAQRTAQQYFSSESMAQSMIGLYKEVCQSVCRRTGGPKGRRG